MDGVVSIRRFPTVKRSIECRFHSPDTADESVPE